MPPQVVVKSQILAGGRGLGKFTNGLQVWRSAGGCSRPAGCMHQAAAYAACWQALDVPAPRAPASHGPTHSCRCCQRTSAAAANTQMLLQTAAAGRRTHLQGGGSPSASRKDAGRHARHQAGARRGATLGCRLRCCDAPDCMLLGSAPGCATALCGAAATARLWCPNAAASQPPGGAPPPPPPAQTPVPLAPPCSVADWTQGQASQHAVRGQQDAAEAGDVLCAAAGPQVRGARHDWLQRGAPAN